MTTANRRTIRALKASLDPAASLALADLLEETGADQAEILAWRRAGLWLEAVLPAMPLPGAATVWSQSVRPPLMEPGDNLLVFSGGMPFLSVDAQTSWPRGGLHTLAWRSVYWNGSDVAVRQVRDAVRVIARLYPARREAWVKKVEESWQ